jgi:hypothetical protein
VYQSVPHQSKISFSIKTPSCPHRFRSWLYSVEHEIIFIDGLEKILKTKNRFLPPPIAVTPCFFCTERRVTMRRNQRIVISLLAFAFEPLHPRPVVSSDSAMDNASAIEPLSPSLSVRGPSREQRVPWMNIMCQPVLFQSSRCGRIFKKDVCRFNNKQINDL